MEKEPAWFVRRAEQGSALAVVLVAMLILLPLAFILSAMVLSWQRQSADFRDMLGQELAARAGFEEAYARLSGRQIAIDPGQVSRFETDELGGFRSRVRVTRQPDAVLGSDGRVLGLLEVDEADLKATGLDPEGRRVRRYRKLEVYVVEAEVAARPSLAGARLLGVLARREDSSLVPLGLTLERGFF